MIENVENIKNEDGKFISKAEKPRFSMEVKGEEYRFISKEDEDHIEKTIEDIKTFVSEKGGSNTSEEEKLELQKELGELWDSLGNKDNGYLSQIKYGFVLNRKQYNLLISLLRDKMEYDINTLFFAIELTEFLGSTLEEKTFEDDEKPIVFDLSATDMTYLYTVLSKHVCKGLTSKTYLFSEIIRRIGDISKVINYYNNISSDLSENLIRNWYLTLGDDRVVEENTESVKGEKVG